MLGQFSLSWTNIDTMVEQSSDLAERTSQGHDVNTIPAPLWPSALAKCSQSYVEPVNLKVTMVTFRALTSTEKTCVTHVQFMFNYFSENISVVDILAQLQIPTQSPTINKTFFNAFFQVSMIISPSYSI